MKMPRRRVSPARLEKASAELFSGLGLGGNPEEQETVLGHLRTIYRGVAPVNFRSSIQRGRLCEAIADRLDEMPAAVRAMEAGQATALLYKLVLLLRDTWGDEDTPEWPESDLEVATHKKDPKSKPGALGKAVKKIQQWIRQKSQPESARPQASNWRAQREAEAEAERGQQEAVPQAQAAISEEKGLTEPEEKPAGQPAEEQEEGPATEPAEEAEEEPATKPAEESTEDPTEEPAEKPAIRRRFNVGFGEMMRLERLSRARGDPQVETEPTENTANKRKWASVEDDVEEEPRREAQRRRTASPSEQGEPRATPGLSAGKKRRRPESDNESDRGAQRRRLGTPPLPPPPPPEEPAEEELSSSRFLTPWMSSSGSGEPDTPSAPPRRRRPGTPPLPPPPPPAEEPAEEELSSSRFLTPWMSSSGSAEPQTPPPPSRTREEVENQAPPPPPSPPPAPRRIPPWRVQRPLQTQRPLPPLRPGESIFSAWTRTLDDRPHAAYLRYREWQWRQWRRTRRNPRDP